MHTTNAIILCLVSYPCIVAWVIYKNRFVDYLFLTLLACLGSIFSVVLYKQPDYSLTIYQAVAVGYAAVIMPTVLVLSVVNIFMGFYAGTAEISGMSRDVMPRLILNNEEQSYSL